MDKIKIPNGWYRLPANAITKVGDAHHCNYNGWIYDIYGNWAGDRVGKSIFIRQRKTWQPIASALKRKSAVYLGWNDYWDRPKIIWHDGYCSSWIVEGRNLFLQPTHWMPLPNSPHKLI
jgi:hypothetical protein